MKKYLPKITSLVAIAFVISQAFFASSARAEDKISVKLNDSDGEHLQGNELFKADNIYPGWSSSKTIYVKNKSETYETDLYFMLDVHEGGDAEEKLSKKLKLYVTRLGSNKSVRIGGSNDRFTLNSADEEDLFLDRLSKDAGKRYTIKIKFDEDAGNEFQGLSTNFDIDFTIKAIINPSQTITTILTNQDRIVPAEDLTQAEADTEVLGDKTPTMLDKGAEAENDGKVEGASTDCKNTEKQPWIIALVILALVLGANTFKRIKEDSYGWKFDVLAVAILLIAWYLLETCHLLRWVPFSAIAIGVVIHLGLPFLYPKTKK